MTCAIDFEYLFTYKPFGASTFMFDSCYDRNFVASNAPLFYRGLLGSIQFSRAHGLVPQSGRSG